MNVNKVLTRDYEEKRPSGPRQNKPNQTQFQTQHLSKLFLPFTFVCPGNVANGKMRRKDYLSFVFGGKVTVPGVGESTAFA